MSCGYFSATLIASRSSTDALVVYCAQVGRLLEPRAARPHLLDREKRVEIGLRLIGRTVELTDERIRAAGAALVSVDDVAPRAQRAASSRAESAMNSVAA